MSDDEDNQSLIDEIQALEDALDQRRTLSNKEFASTSGISNINTLKLEIKFGHNHSNIYVDEGDLVIDDFYENYDCKDLQDLLELNKKLIESLLLTRDNVINLLEECLKRQQLIEEQISKDTSSWYTKIVTFNAGMPYFKDQKYFTPKQNEDTITKIRNGELRLTELQRIHRWNQMDKSNLLKAIRHEVTLTLLNKDEPDEVYIDNSITKTSQLPSDVKKAIGSLGSMKFDWLKIANNIPDNKHNAEECEVMWNVFLHPDINKQKWTKKEDKDLNRIVEEYEFEDWDNIATALKTKRSGYQCFVRYNTNNWKNLMKGQFWSPIDDNTLIYLVTQLKIGDYIPWGYIASCMSNWTKQQVYFRWTYSLASHLKKGRFSKEEDQKLIDAVTKYGPNFSKISALVMTNRTNIQLKEHFQTLTARNCKIKKIWTVEEDALLIELKKKYGSNWVRIAKEMPDVTRVQARQRYTLLIRYQQKGVRLEQINRNENPEDTISTHTTVTYTTNTPWSRENKEIFIKYLKIDDQLINFFKKDNILRRKFELQRKSYHPEKLKEHTKKLYNILLKLNANLDVPDYITDEMELSELNQQLLASLQYYVRKRKTYFSKDVERIRLQMFGPQDPVQDKQRFIPALPFNFRLPKHKRNSSNTINFNLDIREFHQTELIMMFEPNRYVREYLGEDMENQFEKLKKTITVNAQKPEKIYSLKCKSFANSILFDNHQNDIFRRSSIAIQNKKYDWESNRMISKNSFKEKVITDNISIPIIEPNRTTLQAYQELLLISGTFPSESSEMNSDYKLTPRGREALYLFKKRYEQLFHVPTGLSRIIPPDTVDESAFLPALEKLQKKNVKRKRLKKIIKILKDK
ncbi:PREDICTED: snRNA-activating protein complex subunit 4 [Ceratosolen solmsi marchali]|uniref:snRNA-activating protein complex subunit 4 n=1 Tax=Ceratosolen solmsi marchali TaxID=326594 RepID=A0AAJ6YNA7_9HYME|nr:PREDICTED: snRNA-activating protein complex subunit 4 [Ceratosolen solmsi marchali]